MFTMRGKPRYGCGNEEIGQPIAEAIAATSAGGMFIGIKVLLSKLICRSEKAEKVARISFK